MKVTLEFNLPEEHEAHHCALMGGNYKGAMQELDNWLRSVQKYTDKDMVTIESVREKLNEALEGHGVELY